MRKSILVFVSALVFGAAAPAFADDLSVNPMIQKSTDQGAHTVILQGRDNLHGLRTTINNVESRTTGVNYRTAKGIKCVDYPNVSCVRIKINNWGPNKFPDPDTGPCFKGAWACAQLGGVDPSIWVNTYYGTPTRNLMCHEFTHTLGLRHHSHAGCVGTENYKNPTNRELKKIASVTPWLQFSG